jgi:serine phosphatase RsbU (regulator of sigma subunit)/CheY-like chemotaxis protein
VTAGDDVTLLLVDDTPENLIALVAVLEPLGYRLLTARSGEEALRHLLHEQPALILLDVRMPGMDGFETARHVKGRPTTADIPIVFLTAFGDDTARVAEGISSGAVDYLTKPVDPNLLRAKVQVLVDLRMRTLALQEEREELAQRLDEQYAAETRTLQRLADAAVAINSTQALSATLLTINDSARQVIRAHQAETVLLVVAGDAGGARSRSVSPKYAAWASATGDIELRSLLDLVWEDGGPVRMTAKDVEAAFGTFSLSGVASGHPFLEGWLAVPVIGRTGRRLGVIQVADKEVADFTESDELVLTQLAQLAAVAIENAERYEIEHEVAQTLQRTLLPRSLPAIDGLAVTARYRPGRAGTQVGGDWYDVIPLDDGRVALTVGDVMGRGARAAAVMGQLRTALRAYALMSLPPTVMLHSLDLLLRDIDPDALATATLLVLDPSTRAAEVVSAGHLPPLILDGEGVPHFLKLTEIHPPLGVAAVPVYVPALTTLPEGATLLLYTDGLVEERTASLDDGFRRLAEVVRDGPADLDAMCDNLLATMVPADKNDDIAILAARLR